MRNTVKTTMLLIWLGSLLIGLQTTFGVTGEIKDTIFFYTALFPPGEEYVEPFRVQFVFDPLPQLNQISIVHLKIEALGHFYLEPLIGTFRSDVSIVCDQFAQPRWIPPIEKGDIYEGSFKIIPTKSGKFITGISIITSEDPYPPTNVYRVFFGYTKSGKLAYLSDEPGSATEDSLADFKLESKGINLQYEGNHFLCDFLIGIPQLKETTNVYFRITGKEDCPQGIEINIDGSEGLKIMGQNEAYSGTIDRVFRYKGAFKILPRRIGESHIKLMVEEVKSSGEMEKRFDFFEIFLLLDEKGKIKKITKPNQP